MFVARSTTYHVTHLQRMMKLALTKTGFSVLEVVSQCPTLYGRHQRIGDAVKMLEWFKGNSVDVSKVDDPWSETERFVIGVLHDREEVPPYTKLYGSVRDASQGNGTV
jgi:2-oxoglutarate ferredoxin oxidoreductase subunit beta